MKVAIWGTVALGKRQPHHGRPSQIMKSEAADTGTGAGLGPRGPKAIRRPGAAIGVGQDQRAPALRGIQRALSAASRLASSCACLSWTVGNRRWLASYADHGSRSRSPWRCPVHRASTNASLISADATASSAGYLLLPPKLVCPVGHIKTTTLLARVGCDHPSILGERHDAGQHRPGEVGLPRRRGKPIPPGLELAAHASIGERCQRQIAELVLNQRDVGE